MRDKMSIGKKLVWAAIFGQQYKQAIANPPAHIAADTSKWPAWETQQLLTVVEDCTYAMNHLEALRDEVAGVFGKHIEFYRYLAHMLKD